MSTKNGPPIISEKPELEIYPLFTGFSNIKNNIMQANCSCTLIKTATVNCIIDTMTAWDGPRIVEALKKRHNLTPDEINYVICTHGHADHIGTNYLFKNATHIVGFSISKGETYFLTPDFSQGEEYHINNNIRVVPTPGHTLQSVSVICTKNNGEIYAITGDLFENEADLLDETIWRSVGSDNAILQQENREKILKIADFIIPGHGAQFRVPQNKKAEITAGT